MKRVYFFSSIIFFVALIAAITVESCNNKSANNEHAAAAKNEFEFKENLSDYGFFEGQLKDLTAKAAVVRYELSTPLFTDYAVKDRFIVLPKGKQIKYTQEGVLDFPDSTIIIKNFAYTNTDHQKIMIETRLLVKDPGDKKWKVMGYLWNAAQTDAVKHITGAQVPVTLLDDDGNKISTTYRVPNINDCKRCHTNNNELAPIGPKARNLNFTIPDQTENQLTQWVSKNMLSGLPDIAHVEQLPNWKDDKHFTLEQRARAYMDINCAHCHNKGGDASNTGLFLEYQQADPYHIGIMKAPVSAGGGAGGLNYDIIPGDVAHSILAYRMNSAEAGTAMPELGRTIIHKEGVKLIAAWISKLPKQKNK